MKCRRVGDEVVTVFDDPVMRMCCEAMTFSPNLFALTELAPIGTIKYVMHCSAVSTICHTSEHLANTAG